MTGENVTGENPVLSVDVMLPAYGDGPLLREAVAGVLAQDSPGWRLQVSDDGPEDPGLQRFFAGLAEQWGADKVGYRRNPRTLGINRNFQRCFDEARGDLVVVLGADDRMLPDYVRTVAAAAAAHPAAAWIQPGVRIIDAAGRTVLPLADRIKAVLRSRVHPGVLGSQHLLGSLLQGNWMYFPSVAFRREIVQKYGIRTGYDVVMDLDLYARVLFDGHEAFLLDHVCFEYRRHAASLSSAEAVSGGRFDEELACFAEIRQEARRRGWTRTARAAGQHLASRLHAAALAPSAARAHDARLLLRMLRHSFGPTR